MQLCNYVLQCFLDETFRYTMFLNPQDFEILGWCPAGPVLPHGEKVPL